MPRLPQVNQDANTWGSLLNEYLSREHAADGAHGAVTATSVKTPTLHADDLRAKGPVVDVRAFVEERTNGDDVPCIRAAIDHAKAHGGVVYLPAGQYICKSTLRLEGVALIGSGVQHDPTGWPTRDTRGTQLLIDDELLNETAPFMEITGPSVVIEGLNFFYPGQDGSGGIKQFPATIKFKASAEITDVRISGCSFINSRVALDMTVQDNYAIGRIHVEKCHIYGIHEAIRIEGAWDVVSISDCILGPNTYNQAVWGNGGALARETNLHGKGLILQTRADGVTVSNTLIHGYGTGIWAQAAYSLRVVQCLFECITGIHLVGTTSFAVNGCGFWTAHRFESHHPGGGGYRTQGFSVKLEPAGARTTGLISGNIFHASTSDHIHVGGTPQYCLLTVAGNSFRSWGLILEFPAAGSEPEGPVDAAAIRVGAGSVVFHCTGNTFFADRASTGEPKLLHGIISESIVASIQSNHFFGCTHAVLRTGGGSCMVSGNMAQMTFGTQSIADQGSPCAMVATNLVDQPVTPGCP